MRAFSLLFCVLLFATNVHAQTFKATQNFPSKFRMELAAAFQTLKSSGQLRSFPKDSVFHAYLQGTYPTLEIEMPYTPASIPVKFKTFFGKRVLMDYGLLNLGSATRMLLATMYQRRNLNLREMEYTMTFALFLTLEQPKARLSRITFGITNDSAPARFKSMFAWWKGEYHSVGEVTDMGLTLHSELFAPITKLVPAFFGRS
jgi:hypothetical protein